MAGAGTQKTGSPKAEIATKNANGSDHDTTTYTTTGVAARNIRKVETLTTQLNHRRYGASPVLKRLTRTWW